MHEDSFQKAQMVVSYKNTFLSDDHGQAVLADLAARGHLDTPTITPGDPHMTSFKEGRRSLVLDIMEMLNIDIRAYLTDNVVMEDAIYE